MNCSKRTRRISPVKRIVALIHVALMGQVLALQSPDGGADLCDSNGLEQARRAFRADDLSLAERLAEPLVSCPGSVGEEAAGFWDQIKTRRHNERLWQRAQLLIRQSKLEAACDLLDEIGETAPNFPNLKASAKSASCEPGRRELLESLKEIDEQIEREVWNEALATLKSLPEEHSEREEVKERRTLVEKAIRQLRREAVAREYREAEALFDRDDLGGARDRLLRLLKNEGTHREAQSLLNRVDSRLESEEKSRAVSQLSDQARELASSGDLSAALHKIEQALELDESAPELVDLRQQLREKLQEEETRLREAVQSYYKGDYPQAIARLRDYLGERHRPRFSATASFFLGASLVSASLRSKQDPPPELDAARQHFRELRKTDPGFVAPLESVSPKVGVVFAEATRQ